MEYSIDRSSYRRHSNEISYDNDTENKKLIYRFIRKLIIQSVAGGLVLLSIYTLKVMKIDNAIEWLKEEENKDIPISVAYETVKNKVQDLYSNLMIITDKENTSNVENTQNEESDESKEIEPNDTILSIETSVPNEPIFEEAVEGVNQMSEDAKYINENYKFIYPIQGQVTSRFGVRVSDNPIVTAYHSGIDLAANTGTKINAAISGKVTVATTGEAYGKHIMIQTGDVVTVYAHCSKINVKEGQNVKQGDVIGEVGSTGWATGPHLHFEIRYDGRLVNPADILDFGE